MSRSRLALAYSALRERARPLIAIAGLIAFACYALFHDPSDGYHARLPMGHRHLRALLNALGRYQSSHGTYPHHQSGSDFALYEVREDLSAGCLVSSQPPLFGPWPSWDESERRARNSNWDYMNVADPGPPDPGYFDLLQIIVVERRKSYPGYVWVATRGGSIRHIEMTHDDIGVLLGSYLFEFSIAANKTMIHEWNRLEPCGDGWSSSGEHAHPFNSSQKLTYNVVRKDGRPISRKISCGEQVIEETIVSDKFGRMMRIERTPANWESLWESWKGDTKMRFK